MLAFVTRAIPPYAVVPLSVPAGLVRIAAVSFDARRTVRVRPGKGGFGVGFGRPGLLTM